MGVGVADRRRTSQEEHGVAGPEPVVASARGRSRVEGDVEPLWIIGPGLDHIRVTQRVAPVVETTEDNEVLARPRGTVVIAGTRGVDER